MVFEEGCSLIRVVSLSLMSVVFHQDCLSLVWFFIRWSFIRWSLVRVVSHQGCLIGVISRKDGLVRVASSG